MSPCPLSPGEPPKTTTSRTPSTLQGRPPQPLFSLQGSFLLPGQVLGHPGWTPTLQGPPLFYSFLSPPRSLSSVGPLIPQPGALSALWTGPSTIGDPFSTLWLPPPSRGPPLSFRTPLPPGPPPRAPTAHVGPASAKGREDKASPFRGRRGHPSGVPLPPRPQGASWRPRSYPPHPEARSTAENWVEPRTPAMPYTEALQRPSQFGDSPLSRVFSGGLGPESGLTHPPAPLNSTSTQITPHKSSPT